MNNRSKPNSTDSGEESNTFEDFSLSDMNLSIPVQRKNSGAFRTSNSDLSMTSDSRHSELPSIIANYFNNDLKGIENGQFTTTTKTDEEEEPIINNAQMKEDIDSSDETISDDFSAIVSVKPNSEHSKTKEQSSDSIHLSQSDDSINEKEFVPYVKPEHKTNEELSSDSLDLDQPENKPDPQVLPEAKPEHNSNAELSSDSLDLDQPEYKPEPQVLPEAKPEHNANEELSSESLDLGQPEYKPEPQVLPEAKPEHNANEELSSDSLDLGQPEYKPDPEVLPEAKPEHNANEELSSDSLDLGPPDDKNNEPYSNAANKNPVNNHQSASDESSSSFEAEPEPINQPRLQQVVPVSPHGLFSSSDDEDIHVINPIPPVLSQPSLIIPKPASIGFPQGWFTFQITDVPQIDDSQFDVILAQNFSEEGLLTNAKK